MKKTIKLLCVLMALCLMLPMALVSCKKDEPAGKPDETPAPPAEPDYLELFSDGAPKYVIVRSENAEFREGNAAIKLRNAFDEKFGACPDIVTDKAEEGVTPSDDDLEILIGNTNRQESKDVIAALEADTFAVKVVGKKVVIAAASNVMLENAVEYFKENFIDNADKHVRVSKTLSFVGVLGDYPAVKVLEDGSSVLRLQYFNVVFDKGCQQMFVPGMAQALGTRASAIVPNVKADDDATVSELEILFGKCEREQYTSYGDEFRFRDFFLYFKDGKLSVDAFSVYGYERAINFVCDALTEGKVTIPKDGLYSEYKYSDDTFGKVLENYENQTMEGAWIVNMCHRGDVTNYLPENSLPSYQSCIDNKVDIIETDLKLTKDGVWVICHDGTIDRTTSGSGAISSLTLERVKNVFLLTKNGGTGAKKTEYKVPTLEEIIELCQGHVIFNLDHLSKESFQSVYDVFEKYGAQDMAMFKGSGITNTFVANWFAELAAQGRKLPLFSPLCYSNNGTTIKNTLTSFKGLSSLIEMNYSGATDAQLKEVTAHAVSVNIRPLNMTIYENEVAATWEKLVANGYNAFMTDEPIRLKEFIHGK